MRLMIRIINAYICQNWKYTYENFCLLKFVSSPKLTPIAIYFYLLKSNFNTMSVICIEKSELNVYCIPMKCIYCMLLRSKEECQRALRVRPILFISRDSHSASRAYLTHKLKHRFLTNSFKIKTQNSQRAIRPHHWTWK